MSTSGPLATPNKAVLLVIKEFLEGRAQVQPGNIIAFDPKQVTAKVQRKLTILKNFLLLLQEQPNTSFDPDLVNRSLRDLAKKKSISDIKVDGIHPDFNQHPHLLKARLDALYQLMIKFNKHYSENHETEKVKHEQFTKLTPARGVLQRFLGNDIDVSSAIPNDIIITTHDTHLSDDTKRKLLMLQAAMLPGFNPASVQLRAKIEQQLKNNEIPKTQTLHLNSETLKLSGKAFEQRLKDDFATMQGKPPVPPTRPAPIALSTPQSSQKDKVLFYTVMNQHKQNFVAGSNQLTENSLQMTCEAAVRNASPHQNFMINRDLPSNIQNVLKKNLQQAIKKLSKDPKPERQKLAKQLNINGRSPLAKTSLKDKIRQKFKR